MKFGLLFGMGTFILSTGAAAQTCAGYVGQTVKPITIQQAIAGLPKVEPKSEFETTAQYDARLKAAGSPSTIVVAKRINDIYVKYDADAQVMRIRSDAFQPVSEWYLKLWRGAPKNLLSRGSNVAVEVDSDEAKVVRSYEAQNGYGASATVTRRERSVYTIFDRALPGFDRYEPIFTEIERQDQLPPVAMDAQIAQRVKPNLRIAFVTTPKAPFYFESRHSGGSPTISDPDVTDDLHKVMVADLQCGLLTDGNDAVLAAYEIK
ncbi:hypothetical protein GR702_11670 [Novosphingobium sp. FGD1]|uniref:Uncharacterized protein n=1 Tax=Novosphingobium silvae TaxID=2692619 RepID=A0A7X4K7W2_9SPHN|nr:hypothetical protein [Novosphingobium silvae]MYL98422.1 hypothetical protein [Novosphingobium silvae]